MEDLILSTTILRILIFSVKKAINIARIDPTYENILNKFCDHCQTSSIFHKKVSIEKTLLCLNVLV